jgi:hypothetical protein
MTCTCWMESCWCDDGGDESCNHSDISVRNPDCEDCGGILDSTPPPDCPSCEYGCDC